MRKSFTLVELLIVVTIISVLTGAAVPYVNEYLESARGAKAGADLDELARACMAFEAATGREYDDTTGNVLKGRYIVKIPLDPWGVEYSFNSATDLLGATIVSAGPDRTLGNADDLAVGYKGALAVVSAKWFDFNGDGKVSANSPSYPNKDKLLVRFNRAVENNGKFDDVDAWQLTGGPTPFFTIFASSTTPSKTFAERSSDGKQVTFDFHASPTSAIFQVGVTELSIADVVKVADMQGNPSVSASATILVR